MVACVPYPVAQPGLYAAASEVATLAHLRAHDLPVRKALPRRAQAEYIFILKEANLASILRQLVKLESQITLDYVNDLRLKVATGENTGCIPLSLKGGHKFCVGPDVRLYVWHGRRSELDVNRGPCTSLWASLSPSPSTNPSAHSVSVRHPDLHPSNVMVLLDWQHAPIHPAPLLNPPRRYRYTRSPPEPRRRLPTALAHHAALADSASHLSSFPARWVAETHGLKALEATEAWGTRLAGPVAFAADDDNVSSRLLLADEDVTFGTYDARFATETPWVPT
ncbi:hypothetical protein R3P38DRAFT_3313908 [Favolaschia claudopus]|uniref:Aminoglycoside phosphotransferase domain-containing protein n=1 Tax=Favolaschia claudopus TaxID=2862362 RepID=A0AAW0BV32_9AGAR